MNVTILCQGRDETQPELRKLASDFELPGASVDEWIAAARLVEIALTSEAALLAVRHRRCARVAV